MKLLDLFCGAGGAGVGYARVGFEVVGVDKDPQPNYPFEFHQANALEFPLDGFDVIHASPPCQFASRATAWRGDRSTHPNLIPPTQARLRGRPHIIENVQEARFFLRDPLMLCGTMFGIGVQSHRWFEIEPTLALLLPGCRHQRDDAIRDHGGKQTEAAFRAAIGCDWMTVHEAREAIPPVFTEYIGAKMMAQIGVDRGYSTV